MWKKRIALGLTSSFLMLSGCADAPTDHESIVPRLLAETALPTVITPQPKQEVRLRLYHLHTGESIDVAYRRGEQELSSGMAMLNHFLRDWRTGQDASYPVKEFDLLHAVLVKLHRPNAEIDIICGYRSAETNSSLRGDSPSTGVAENSQHMLSHAIDISVPGISTRRLRDAALSLGMGGVGYYPRSQFVHVDVGPVRQWSFGTERHRNITGHPRPLRHGA